MLKSKKSLYFLFPVVVIIWGILIWKIVSSFSDPTPVPPELPTFAREPVQTKNKDTFSLLKLERDPFLGTPYTKPAVAPKISKDVVSIIEWPPIKYLGLVSDTRISSRIHIVQINNNQYLLERGEEAEGVRLLQAMQAKVILGYSGKQKEFIKSN